MLKYGILMTPGLAQKAHDGDKTVTRRLLNPQPSHRKDKDGAEMMLHYDKRTNAWFGWKDDPNSNSLLVERWKPRYRPGMIVAVKETHWRYGWYRHNAKNNWTFIPDPEHLSAVIFRKPNYPGIKKYRIGYHKRSGLFMPYDYARTYIEILDVRPELLQDITEEDAVDEGLIVQIGDGLGPRSGYKWDGPAYQDPVTGNFHVPSDKYCRCDIGGRLQLTAGRCAFRALWDSINGKKAPWDSNPWVWRYAFRKVDRL